MKAPDRTVRVGAVELDAATMHEAVEALLGRRVETPELAVTLNVDHMVLLEHDAKFADAYAEATFRFADGAPIVLLSRLLGDPLPERVTGIDLTYHLLEACEGAGRSVAFFGGTQRALDQAVAAVTTRHPRLNIVGAWCPTVASGVADLDERIALDALRSSGAEFVFLFLGAPKQEKWFLDRRAHLPAAVFLGVGGAVDMIGGSVRRAPRWMHRAGLEWVWRFVQEPRRLFRRYVIQDSAFVVIAARLLWRRWCTPNAASPE